MVSVAASAWLYPPRRRGEPGRGADHGLAGVAVDAVAGHGREVADRGRAVLPLREEAGDDVVADRELGHALAHRLHHAGAVGHRDAPVRRRHPSAHDGVVVVVERARVEPDPDLARAGGAGVGHVDELQPVEPAGRAEYDALHFRPDPCPPDIPDGLDCHARPCSSADSWSIETHVWDKSGRKEQPPKPRRSWRAVGTSMAHSDARCLRNIRIPLAKSAQAARAAKREVRVVARGDRPEPGGEAVEIDRGRGRHVLQVGPGQPAIAAAAQPEGAHPLREGALDPGPPGVAAPPLLGAEPSRGSP